MDSNSLQQSSQRTEEIKTNVNQQKIIQEQTLESSRSIWESLGESSAEVKEKERTFMEVQNNPDVWKYEKKCKKAKNEWRVAKERDAKRREAFLKPSLDMVNKVKGQLELLKHNDQNQLTAVTACMENCIKSNDMEFNVDEVINEEKDKTPEFMELSELFTELKSESAFTISEEKTKELLEKYNKLNLKVEATCSKYLKTEKRDGMDFTAESTTDKEYRYYLLYNSVATALRNHVDKMDPQKVNMNAFSKLCGIELSSALAVNAMCNNKEFVEKREANINKKKDVYKIKSFFAENEHFEDMAQLLKRSYETLKNEVKQKIQKIQEKNNKKRKNKQNKQQNQYIKSKNKQQNQYIKTNNLKELKEQFNKNKENLDVLNGIVGECDDYINKCTVVEELTKESQNLNMSSDVKFIDNFKKTMTAETIKAMEKDYVEEEQDKCKDFLEYNKGFEYAVKELNREEPEEVKISDQNIIKFIKEGNDSAALSNAKYISKVRKIKQDVAVVNRRYLKLLLKRRYEKSIIQSLKNTENLSPHLLEHIFLGNRYTGEEDAKDEKGNIVKDKDGKIVKETRRVSGYHFVGIKDSAAEMADNDIVDNVNEELSLSVVNELGVFSVKVQSREKYGPEKKAIMKKAGSTCFPRSMSPQDIVDAINIAYSNRVQVKGELYSGHLNNGLIINMYIKNGEIKTAFPVKEIYKKK